MTYLAVAHEIFEAELVNAVVPDSLPSTTHSDDPALLSFCVFASQFHLSHCPGGLVMSMSRNSSGGTSFLMPHLSNTSCLIHCRQPRIKRTRIHEIVYLYVSFYLSTHEVAL